MTIIRQAKEEDEKGNYEAAFRLYESGVEHFLVANKYEKNESARETVKKRVIEYMDRMDLLKKSIRESNSRGASPNPNGAVKPKRKNSSDNNGKLYLRLKNLKLKFENQRFFLSIHFYLPH